MTIEEIVESMDITEVGSFLFKQILLDASKYKISGSDAHNIWERYYDIQPSYADLKGSEYFQKMKEKYLLTYKLTLEEIQGKKNDS